VVQGSGAEHRAPALVRARSRQVRRVRRRYRDELALAPANDGVARLRLHAENEGIVLVTATRDVAHSGAEVLLDLLVS